MTTGFQRALRFIRLVALLFALSMVLPMAALAQGGSIHGQAVNSTGRPAAFATVRVCPYSGGGIPCNPLSNVYSDLALAHQVSNPYTTDQYGNYSFFVATSAAYIVQVNVGATSGGTYSYLITVGGSGGGGSSFQPPNYAIQYCIPGSPCTPGGSAATVTAAGDTVIPNTLSVGTTNCALNGYLGPAYLYLNTSNNTAGPHGTINAYGYSENFVTTGSGNHYDANIVSVTGGLQVNVTSAQGGIAGAD